MNTETASPSVNGKKMPKTIAVEGVIGAGKTSLAKALAHSLDYPLVLEHPERNPFLGQFYKNKAGNALAAQLYFLLERSRSGDRLRQKTLEKPATPTRWIADFMMERDRLFAEVTLSENELGLYRDLSTRLFPQENYPVPDLVVLLQATPDTLIQRIRKRGHEFEQRISLNYLEELNRAYNRFFLHYSEAPVLIINTDNVDLVTSVTEYQHFLKMLAKLDNGRHYFNKVVV